MAKKRTRPITYPETLSWAALRDLTGASFPRIYRMVKDGVLPQHGQFRGRNRFRGEDVQRLVEAGAFRVKEPRAKPPRVQLPADAVPVHRVANMLGMSSETIRRMIADGEIAATRTSDRRAWCRRQDVLDLIRDEHGFRADAPEDLIPLHLAADVLGVSKPTFIGRAREWGIRTFIIAKKVARYSEADVRAAAGRITWDGKRGSGKKVVYE